MVLTIYRPVGPDRVCPQWPHRAADLNPEDHNISTSYCNKGSNVMSWSYDQWRNEGAGAPRRSKGWGPYVQTAKPKTNINTLYRDHISHLVKHTDTINLFDLTFYFAYFLL